MSDLPWLDTFGWPPPHANMLSTMGPESVGWLHHIDGASTQVNISMGASDRAIYTPLYVPRAVVAKQLFVVTTTASGNIDVGIYDYEGNRLVSAGSTAMSGSTLQMFDVTDTALPPGRYYLAVAVDNNTGTVGASRGNFNQPGLWRLAGICMQETAFPLPATATFATMTASFCPWVGVQIGRVL